MALIEGDLSNLQGAGGGKGFSSDTLDRLTIRYNEFTLYKAGLPGYEGTFARDDLISAFLAQDREMLRNTLEFSASLQGRKKDSRTGEEPGKIFHEYSTHLNGGVELRSRPGKTTLFSASDTTALFLLGHEVYLRLTNDGSLIRAQKDNIELATQYIRNHLDGNFIFTEDPKFAGAESFALNVTYWKDSALVGRKEGEPVYPVIYPLAHIQNMVGLRAASRLLESYLLRKISDNMRHAIYFLWDSEIENFPIAIDREGKIEGVSSDGLHSLFYLEPQDISDDRVSKIIDSSAVLETPLGYRTLSEEMAKNAKDKYHANTVWTQEQAQIHAGARKHLLDARKRGNEELAQKLSHVMSVAIRVNKYLRENPQNFPELFVINGSEITPGGNDPQLWAVAAKRYFDSFLSTH